MRPFAALLRHAGRPVDDDLARYQVAAFSNQLPVLYLILLINGGVLIATHAKTAPVVLTVIVPAALGAICLMRIVYWLRSRNVTLSSEQAVRRLRATTPLVLVLGAGFTAWALSLYPYGDSYAKCHVAFYMSFTVISCIFCLMHLRNAALLLAAVFIVPFTIFFGMTGQPVFVAIALNFVVVTFGMGVVLSRNYSDFTTMIVSRRELMARQEEAQRLSDENNRLAHLDGLTGLPNRRSFLSQLDAALTRAQNDPSSFAVALFDLDGFKGVNDLHGHTAGDRLLLEVGQRLSLVASPTVFPARLGGDEFGIIIEGAPSHADVLGFGRRLCALLGDPYLKSDIGAEVAVSAGLVVYPDAGTTAEQLFERADYALYHAKQHARGDAVMFSGEHETMIRDASRIEQALRHADLAREMWLAYQPILDSVTGRTMGFEALARWSSPELGAVPPDVFIRVAEHSQLIGLLTETLLRKALACAASWPEELRVSVNLSAHDLGSLRTMAAVHRIISESGVAASRIEFEITETAVMRDFNQAAESLTSLRQLGVSVSLDDFGTGFSSLSHVHRLKLDKIKIDRSFVDEIQTSQTSCDIVKTVVDLCRNLGLDCVVEGVETDAQRRKLMGLGCRYMQGYLFSRPMPEPALAAYFMRQKAALIATG